MIITNAVLFMFFFGENSYCINRHLFRNNYLLVTYLIFSLHWKILSLNLHYCPRWTRDLEQKLSNFARAFCNFLYNIVSLLFSIAKVHLAAVLYFTFSITQNCLSFIKIGIIFFAFICTPYFTPDRFVLKFPPIYLFALTIIVEDKKGMSL